MKKWYLLIALLLHAQISYPSQAKLPSKKPTKELPRYQTIFEQIQKVTPKIDPKLNRKLLDAVEKNDINRVRFLLNPSARSWYLTCSLGRGIPNVNATIYPYGYTALMFAANQGYTDLVQILIAAGANLDIKNDYGDTALMIAVGNIYHNYPEIVKLLINAGADLNIQNTFGQTALISAVESSKDIVQLLIAANADLNIEDTWGETALVIAAKRGYPEKIKLLLKAGAKPTAKFWELINKDREKMAKAMSTLALSELRKRSAMKAVEEYNREAIEYEIVSAWPEAGWQDVSKIIGEYAESPLLQEVEMKEKNENQ
jgi:hypothetical protein